MLAFAITISRQRQNSPTLHVCFFSVDAPETPDQGQRRTPRYAQISVYVCEGDGEKKSYSDRHVRTVGVPVCMCLGVRLLERQISEKPRLATPGYFLTHLLQQRLAFDSRPAQDPRGPPPHGLQPWPEEKHTDVGCKMQLLTGRVPRLGRLGGRRTIQEQPSGGLERQQRIRLTSDRLPCVRAILSCRRNVTAIALVYRLD